MNMFRLLLLTSAAATACLSPGNAATKPSVRHVDFKQAPAMMDLAERARRLGDATYPRILALLTEDPSKAPQEFDIVFKKSLKGQPATTKGKTIYVSAREFSAILSSDPAEVDGLLVHEMVHVAQQYRGMAPIYRAKAPLYWEEGMADYVRYKLGYTNGWSCPQCSFMFPHYLDGYWCAGAFLLYVDATCGADTLRKLNTQLRQGSYTDAFFEKTTGKSLDTLWSEFQGTPAFTPIAAEINALGTRLGDVRNTAASEIQARFEAYLAQNLPDPRTQDARKVLFQLIELGSLPGWVKNDGGWLSSGLPTEPDRARQSVARTFHGQKNHEASLYHYLMVQTSRHADWKLQRAWRTAADGHLLEEYPVP